jgi:hypothetical protein
MDENQKELFNIISRNFQGVATLKTGKRMAHHLSFYYHLLIKSIADWLLLSRANFLFSLMT